MSENRYAAEEQSTDKVERVAEASFVSVAVPCAPSEALILFG
jgi:hypothetical protein